MNRIAAGLMFLVGVSMETVAVAALPIPIDGPVVISQSGNYIVTRDIAAVGMPAIRLLGDAELEVSIDLGGHTISASDTWYGAIVIRTRDECGNRRSLALRNGKLAGPSRGIFAVGGRGCGATLVKVENVTSESAGVDVEDTQITISSSRLGSVASLNNFGPSVVTLVNNRLGYISISAFPAQIFNNYIGQIEVHSGDLGSSQILIAGNTVRGDILIGPWHYDHHITNVDIVRNVVSGYIFVNAEDSQVSENQIFGCGGTGSAVVVGFDSWWNSIDNNQFLGGCDHGIEFGWTTMGNECSGNVFRVYVPEPIVDFGESNHHCGGPEVAPE